MMLKPREALEAAAQDSSLKKGSVHGDIHNFRTYCAGNAILPGLSFALGPVYCPGMEEVKVDLTLCESDGVPHLQEWALAFGVTFVKDWAADQWTNKEPVIFVPPAVLTVRGMEIWIGCRRLGYVPLSEDYVTGVNKPMEIEAGAFLMREANNAILELASTLQAIDESVGFEELRRRLMGAVESGQLWLS